MKHMKRLLSLMLTLLLVLGMSTAAFAEGDAESGDTSSGSDTTAESSSSQTPTDMSSITLTKTISKTNSETTYPGETLTFTSELKTITDSADNSVENRKLDLTIDSVNVSNNAETANINITLPTYTSVGIYTYEIKETNGNVAGVGYYSSAIELKVYVINGTNGQLIRQAVVISKDTKGNKITGITNTYSAGSLSVTKNVTGNMGDKSKYFKVTVTFTAPEDKTVQSEIDISGGSYENNPTEIEVSGGWSSPTTKSVDIYLKNDETVTFTNIPYGVTYTVKEDDYTGNNGGYTTSYKVGETAVANASNGATNAVGGDHQNDTVTITNNKQKEVDTGIDLDSLPYILVLAVACLGLVAFVSKKRMMREN